MTNKPHIPAPTGTEDKAQLQALGKHFEAIARGEVNPRPPLAPPGFTWGFTPEERARLEAARAASAKKDEPKPKQ
jgi:hypothetical protein